VTFRSRCGIPRNNGFHFIQRQFKLGAIEPALKY